MSACKQTKFKVAAAHAAPVFMDKAATLKKVVRLIEQAGAEEIKLLVFPETFVPGYPVRSVPNQATARHTPHQTPMLTRPS
jgi:predicted amidohydrolase